MLAIHSASWKDGARSTQIWRNSLRDYVLPQMGRVRVDRITTADIMAVLLPHWVTKHETMRRIKQRLSRISAGQWPRATGRTIPPEPRSTRPCPERTIHAPFRRLAPWRGRSRDRKGAEQRGLTGNEGHLPVPGPDGLPVRRGPAVGVAGSRSGFRYLDHPGGSIQDTERSQGAAGSASARRAGRGVTNLAR